MDKKPITSNSLLSSEAVLDYLREHPKLLVEHPDLLCEMIIPHSTGEATSLVERQVSVLREQIRQLKNQLKELIDIAQENGELNERLHLLGEKLIQADSMDTVFQIIKKMLITEFKADLVVLRLFINDNDTNEPLADVFKGVDWPGKVLFEEAINNNTPLCGRLNKEQHQALFADELAEYGSSVLLPLAGQNWKGILAIGSHDPQRYRDDMGTEILSQMAGIMTLAINPYVR